MGDTRVIDGIEYKKVDTGYTIREYYSHHTEEKGPGPGWDFRTELLNDEFAKKKFGRTFSREEVFNPSEELPDDPFYQWVPVDAEDKE